ncbi:MAG: GLUG motif-containing protein, partial [Sulfurimonas sp.]
NLSNSTTDYATYASSTANSNAGWNPIGDSGTKFTGTFDGVGNTIGDLYINRPTEDNIGLFGYTTNSSVIKNIGLVDADVTGHWNVGGLVGYSYGSITNAYATGSVNGGGSSGGDVGGLIGINAGGTISNSYATGSVFGASWDVGGLVGWNNNGIITNSYALGSVTGTNLDIGGLVGWNQGTISNSFWDKETSNQATSNGGTGLSTTQMQQMASFTGWSIEEDSTLSSSYKYPVLSVFNGGGSSTWKIYKAPVVVTPTSTPTNTPTQTQINKIITAIVNKNVLTNTDLNTLMNSGIDIRSFINQVKLAGGNLVIIPGIALKVLNGGINLPYGMDREFSLDSTNNQDEKEEENI